MTISELNPYIRYSDKRYTRLIYQTNVMAYDFRLFYIVNGGCILNYDGNRYEIGNHTQIIFPPCKEYSFESTENTELMVLNFDLTFDKSHIHQMPPSPVDNYEYKKAIIPADNTNLIIINNAKENAELIDKIINIRKNDNPYKNELSSALMKQVLINTIIKEKKKSSISPLIQSIINYIDDNFRNRITNNELGSRFNYHPTYINKKFRNETGITIRQFIIDKRINASKEILKSSKCAICDVGIQSGFESASYFTKYFKMSTGLSPKEYRKRYGIM